MLLEDAKKNYSTEELKAFKKIYDFSKQHADEVRLGTGSYGSFSPIFNKNDFCIYTTIVQHRVLHILKYQDSTLIF